MLLTIRDSFKANPLLDDGKRYLSLSGFKLRKIGLYMVRYKTVVDKLAPMEIPWRDRIYGRHSIRKAGTYYNCKWAFSTSPRY